MLIKDVDPITDFGNSFITNPRLAKFMDKTIEMPLINACRIFFEKNIETVMSSANKNNIVKHTDKPLEKEDVMGREFYLDSPTFEDAGKGYAWIMLNFDSLSTENKQLVFDLEQVSKDGNNIGEKNVWFISSTISDIVAFGDTYLEASKQQTEEDKRFAEMFKEKRFILQYNNHYPRNIVVLRKRIYENTTVEEVDKYFKSLASLFVQQKKSHSLLNRFKRRR